MEKNIKTVWNTNEFCLYNNCDKTKLYIKLSFFYKNNKNTRELGLNPVKGLTVNVTFLILDPNPLSLIVPLFCIQIQNVVEMNVIL